MAGRSKEVSNPSPLRRGSPPSWLPVMKNLILNNWLAKCVSLVLALVLWAVIRKNIETTPSRSRIEGESRFQIDTSRHVPAKK